MKKIKNLLVIQARMGSERLPGKVLLKLGKISILEWVIRASKKIRDIDDIIVATTSLKEDKLIEKLCSDKGISLFKGENTDVLSRIYEARTLTVLNRVSNELFVQQFDVYNVF